MPRQRERLIRNEKRGVWQGRFHELSQDGHDTPKLTLCTLEEAETKETATGKRKRSDTEIQRFLSGLYNQKLLELKTARQRAPKTPKSPLVKDLMQRWLDEVGKHSKPTTSVSYAHSAGEYIKACGNHPIQEFKRDYRLRFLEHLQAQGLSPATVRKIVVEVQVFFNWCLEEELLDMPVVLKRPKVPTNTPGTYSPAQIKRLLQHVQDKIAATVHPVYRKGYQNHLRLIYVGIYAGLRAGEMRTLKLSRINLSERRIEIAGVPELEWNVKDWQSRQVPIADPLADFLREDFKTRGDNEVWYLDDGNGGLQFSNTDKISQAMIRHCRALGITGVHPTHGLRSTCATLLADHGVALSIIQEILGHSSSATTEKYYVNRRTLDLQKSINALPDLSSKSVVNQDNIRTREKNSQQSQ